VRLRHRPPETFPFLVQEKVKSFDPPADTPAGGSPGDPPPIQFQSTTPRISYFVASITQFLHNVTGIIVFVTNVFIWERALSFLFNRRRILVPPHLKFRVFILHLLVRSNRSGDLGPRFRAGPACGHHRQCRAYELPVWGDF